MTDTAAREKGLGLAVYGYIADRDLTTALWLMDMLHRPLLLEGEAGVGKTEVARALASLHNTKLIRLQCYEGLDQNAALFEWNYQRQLLAIKAREGDDPDTIEEHIFSERYLLERPLLAAIRQPRPPVLLIDEIDRADEEFEAFLFELLADFQISIPELGTMTATSVPRVVLTSNGTRELSAETRDALALLTDPIAKHSTRLCPAFRALFCGRRSDWEKFDEIFAAFWLGRGGKSALRTSGSAGNHRAAPGQSFAAGDPPANTGEPDRVARVLDESAVADGRGRGGTPIELLHKHRKDKPLRIVVLLDASGSMSLYAPVFLRFMHGVLDAFIEAEAFVFHTRLTHISPALREKDTIRAVERLSLIATGIGGGTRIRDSLATFNRWHAGRVIHSRTAVVIVSDGFDTGDPAVLGAEMRRLRRRCRRIVWLNPMLGWQDYSPEARGMKAALPFIDLFAPAHNLESLVALEPYLARL